MHLTQLCLLIAHTVHRQALGLKVAISGLENRACEVNEKFCTFLLIIMTVEQDILLAPGDAAANPHAVLRSARLAEVISCALDVLGAEAGTTLGAQRRLGEAMSLSSTMIHRYKMGLVDFDNLRGSTIRQLALAARLDPGTVFCWIDQGRDAALDHQRRISQRPTAFTPCDLVRELQHMLCQGGPLALERTPALDAAALQQALADQRDASPALFDRLAAALQIQPLLDELPDRLALDEPEWQQISQLLGPSAHELQQQYIR